MIQNGWSVGQPRLQCNKQDYMTEYVSVTKRLVSWSTKSISSDQMTRLLSKTFRSVKLKASSSKPPPPQQQPSPSSSLPRSRKTRAKSSSNSKSRSWSVYLILSTNRPIKTYVGVTTNFSRRLKQHNGELKGGAKASRAGRPWICACIIRGFNDRSEACKFESKWKIFSRKLPRKRIDDDQMKQSSKDSHRLLQHRKTALDRVKGSFDLSHLEIDWKLNTF
ncbi:hypothetical protein POPTR_001G260600v4 [Populus trichocarpa]|uniref:GIY-YIG domain-containing protein n=1 Tax=Populus trichocarpa TaxID=3694 RepID=A0A3N7EH64_POPTR|nr:structure-specific endonuclease subunit SLX1 [Populus trichocarpa]RQO85392.1 hypothetical protein POPTR_001G260600v4 [Populus trichocarpa]|eukprot:XP_002298410.2 structure-specific endonuclease subunit SLX1 [Populus trichocarpa]